MSAQLAIGYPASYVGSEVWRQRIDVLRSAVNHLGLKEVSYELDVSGSLLSDSLNERDRKRWAGEWLDILKQMLINKRDEIALDLYGRLVELDQVNSPLIEAEMTPEEEAAAAHIELLKFGAAGKAASQRIKRRAKR